MTPARNGAAPWTALVRAAIVGTQREDPPALLFGDDDLDALLACSRRVQELLDRPLGSHTLVAGPVDWR